MNPQLSPLEVNAATGEPFLRLRHHPIIILTPPRWDDAPGLVSILNDFRVSDALSGPPYPYTSDHARRFLEQAVPAANAVLKQLEDAKERSELMTVGDCPMRFIREVKEDGTEVFIGDVVVKRCGYGEFMGTDGIDWENKAKREAENNSLPLGDPNIISSMGDFLAPSHHRQGIMTDAINAVLHDWCIPRMKVRHM